MAATHMPLAIAHRGDSAHAPENTEAAFSAALRSQIDGIELDLRPTRDGQVVVCHDATLRRLGGSRRPLARQTLEALHTADIGSWFADAFAEERLVTLARLLSRFARRTTLLLELKSAHGIGARRRNRTLIEATVRALRDADAVERVFILCFDRTLLDRIGSLEPRLRLVRNTVRLPLLPRRWLRRHAGCHAICLDQRFVTPRVVAAIHAANLRAFTYTCNTAAVVRRVVAAGIDAVLSDDPGWLCTQLGKT